MSTGRIAQASLAALALCLSPLAHGQGLPAFPGADGAAAFATGGRGGLVYHVTKLDKNFSDNEPGTLRYGLSDSNFGGQPRTIVFDVAGTFWLGRFGEDRGHDNGWDTQSRLNLGSHITLAGQTAPGPVYIMGGVVKAGGDNTIVRNVTIAPGYGLRNFAKPDEGVEPTPGDFPDSYVYDAIDISGTNQLFDHLTTLYATDETISANEEADNITIQYSTIAQAQNYPQADAEGGGRFTGHGLGSLLQAGSGAEISVVNNLYAHLKGRLPRVGSESGSGALNDFRNNVFYNWFGDALQTGGSQPSQNNFINNFYLAGPGGEDPIGGTNPGVTTRAGSTDIGSGGSGAKIYASGNVRDTNKDGDANDASAASYSGSYTHLSSALDVEIGVTTTAQQAYDNVLDHVGARWWDRDSVDARLVNEVRTGTGQIMAWADDPFDDDPSEGTEWRQMLSYRADTSTGAAPFNRAADWDQEPGGGDGMPTWWELEHGLDPLTDNHNADFDADGYTDLEEYLNEIAAWPAPGEIVFDGSAGSRYALIQNWAVSGVSVPVQGQGTTTTQSNWQPSRYDAARIEADAVVDAVGQHAGQLTVAGSSTLSVTGGWLKVADELTIESGSTVRVEGGELSAPMLTLPAGASLELVGGRVAADGADDHLVLLGATLSPGVETRDLVIDGGLGVFDGALEIGVSPTEGASSVMATGPVQVGGDLLVSLEGFTPASGDAYPIVFAASVSGVFENLVGDRAPVRGGGSFLVTADATSVTLSDFQASVAGDFNFDGVVDAADYVVWRNTAGVGGLGWSADANDDGAIDAADLAVWRANYGATAPSESQVPEPTGLLLIATGYAAAAARRERPLWRS